MFFVACEKFKNNDVFEDISLYEKESVNWTGRNRWQTI